MKRALNFILLGILFFPLISCEKESTEDNSETFTDSRDGKEYKCVEINGKTWVAENFNYQPTAKSTDDYIDYSHGDVSFKLYRWNIISTIIPDGWHLPSESEYDDLIQSLGGYDVAGNKMKAVGVWEGTVNGNNESGFSALPGSNGELGFLWTYFWTSTEVNENEAKKLMIQYGDPHISIYASSKLEYYCVRLVKNQ